MINFPDTPTLAQIFTTAGSSWQWDGNKWEGATVASGGPYLLLTGGNVTGNLNVSGNVGIGTTGPSGKLHVVNNDSNLIIDTPAANQTASISFRDGGNARWGLFTSASASHDFGLYNSTTASVSLTVQSSSGNVGIGTTTPAFKLHVHYATDVNFMLFNNGGRSALAALNDANNVWNPIDINPSGDVYLSSASGNVGIGTTGPGAKLHVSGPDSSNLLYVSGGSKAIRIGASSTTASIDCVDMPVTSLQPLSVGGSIVLLTTNGAERMRIDNTGNVGIGTATPGTNKLSVVNTTPGWFAAKFTSPNTTPSAGVLINAGTGVAGDYALLIQNAPATVNLMWVLGNGSCANTSGAWTTVSDAQVKQDIAPYRRGLEAILKLSPVEFRYAPNTPMSEGNKPSRLLFGLIADEVKPHVPEIVGTTTATVGKKEGVELSTLEPGNLIYALINAVKELNDQGKEMRAKVAALEGGAR